MSASTTHPDQIPLPQQAAPSRFTALLWGLFGLCIWSGSFVLTRFGVKSNLTAYDIIALRFSTGGLLLLPVLFKTGLGLDRLGRSGFILLVCGAGAPYALLTAIGLRFAPASQAAALTPGLMTVLVALFGIFLLKEILSKRGWLGIVLILSGAFAVASQSFDSGQSYGHLVFFTAAILWAAYVIFVRRSGISALHATALAAVISAIFYLPLYLVFFDKNITTAPLNDIITQAVYQGIFTTIIGLVAFNRAVAGLGAAAGSALSSLIPVVTMILGIIFLQEMPSLTELAATILIISGVLCLTLVRKPLKSK